MTSPDITDDLVAEGKFILLQLSIYQRQGQSVLLVTGYNPTPSSHMTEQD